MRPRLALALLAIAALLAGCTDPSSPAGRVININVGRYYFEPGTNVTLNATRGESLLLRLTSLDVTHGFAITEYGVSTEVPAGKTTTLRLVADKPGDFAIYCTVFCGTGHPQHKGTFHVGH